MQTDTVVLDPEWFRTYNRLGLGSNPTGLILLTIAGWIMIFNDRLARGEILEIQRSILRIVYSPIVVTRKIQLINYST